MFTIKRKEVNMLSNEELDALRDELEPIVMQLAEKLGPNQAIRIDYEIGSVRFDF